MTFQMLKIQIICWKLPSNQTKDKILCLVWRGRLSFEGHEKAVRQLKNLGLNIEASIGPGKHEWYYWNQQIEKVLAWLPIDFELEERLS